MKTDTNDFREARASIAELFASHCAEGAQTHALGDETAAAAGQYLGLDSIQRGLLGVAAAIFVLSRSREQSHKQLVRRLVNYIARREELEKSVRTTAEWNNYKSHLRDDEQSVLKLSELLFALSTAGDEQATRQVRDEVVEKLKALRLNGNTWGYFGRKGDPSLLPTVFAHRALASVGQGKEQSRDWIAQKVRAWPMEAGDANSDMSVQIATMAMLADIPETMRPDCQVAVKQRYLGLIPSVLPMYAQRLEQNIEFSLGSRNGYFRLPWQLQMLQLIAQRSPVRYLTRRPVTRHLTSLVNAVRTEAGFVYPHSGIHPSTRTNAIAYQALASVEDAYSRHHGLISISRGARAIGWTVPLNTMGFGFAGFATWVWCTDPTATVADVGSNVIAALVTFASNLRSRSDGTR